MKSKLISEFGLITALAMLTGVAAVGPVVDGEPKAVLDYTVEPDSELVELLSSETVNKVEFNINDTPIAVVIPDGYNIEKRDDCLEYLWSADENEMTSISYSYIEQNSLADFVKSPLVRYEITEGVVEHPVVSDVSLYITGEQTVTGVSVRNYVDLSNYSVDFPKLLLPEVNYVFPVDGNGSLVMRVSYDSEYLAQVVDTVFDCEKGIIALPEDSDLAGTSEYIESAIEQLAYTFAMHTYYGEYE